MAMTCVAQLAVPGKLGAEAARGILFRKPEGIGGRAKLKI